MNTRECGVPSCTQNLHTHECRRCGADIWCEGDVNGDCLTPWEGDNIGCPNAATEDAAL